MSALPGGVQRIKDYQSWVAIAATPQDFTLNAGVYGLLLHASVWGTAQLQKLVMDGAVPANTYVPLAAAVNADGYGVFYCTAGQYRLVLAGVTGLTGEIAKIGALR